MQTKFTLVLAAMLYAALTTKAQVSKGNIVLGGNLGFNSEKTENETSNKVNSTNFFIAPSIGKVYKDNRIAGFIIKYRYSGNSNSDFNTNSFGAGIYLRQYKSMGKGFYIFLQESLNADFNHDRNLHTIQPDVIQDIKETTTYIVINPGLAYDLNKKLQLELLFFNDLIAAGYYHHNTKYEPDNLYIDYKRQGFYVNTTLDWFQVSSLNIGVKIFFGR